MNRRIFLQHASALGSASLFGLPRPAAAEPPLEITKIKLVSFPAICLAPQYVAEELLRAEGFTDISYTPWLGGNLAGHLGDGNADMTMDPAQELV